MPTHILLRVVIIWVDRIMNLESKLGSLVVFLINAILAKADTERSTTGSLLLCVQKQDSSHSVETNKGVINDSH